MLSTLRLNFIFRKRPKCWNVNPNKVTSLSESEKTHNLLNLAQILMSEMDGHELTRDKITSKDSSKILTLFLFKDMLT